MIKVFCELSALNIYLKLEVSLQVLELYMFRKKITEVAFNDIMKKAESINHSVLL